MTYPSWIQQLRRLFRPVSAWVVFVVSATVYIAFSLGQWRTFTSPSYDLTIFTQAVQRYAAFEAPIVNVKGAGYNLLGDHFHPILALLAPFYAIAPSALTLMILQALMLAASGFFITAAAGRRLGRVPAWLIGFAYVFSWGVQEAHRVQFHEVAFGALIIAIGVWFFSCERWVACAVTLGLLVFVKEDLGLTVAAFGVVLAVASRRWLLGILTMAWGLGWLVLVMKVLLPAVNVNSTYDYSDRVDIGAILADPASTLGEILTNDVKMGTIWMVLIATAFLVLRSPWGLALLPTLAWRFVSPNEGYWDTGWHYSLILMPIMFGAVIDALARLSRSSSAFWRRCADVGPVAVVTVAVTLFPTLPVDDLRSPEFWERTDRAESAQVALELIGEGHMVETDIGLMSHLTGDNDVYYIGSEGNPVPDFLVIDNRNGGWNMEVQLADYAPSLHPDTQWQVVHDDAGIQVAQRIS